MVEIPLVDFNNMAQLLRRFHQINKMKELIPSKGSWHPPFYGVRIPDKPAVPGYTCPNTNSLLEWKMDGEKVFGSEAQTRAVRSVVKEE